MDDDFQKVMNELQRLKKSANDQVSKYRACAEALAYLVESGRITGRTEMFTNILRTAGVEVKERA